VRLGWREDVFKSADYGGVLIAWAQLKNVAAAILPPTPEKAVAFVMPNLAACIIPIDANESTS
jgi:hypothetical protein